MAEAGQDGARHRRERDPGIGRVHGQQRQCAEKAPGYRDRQQQPDQPCGRRRQQNAEGRDRGRIGDDAGDLGGSVGTAEQRGGEGVEQELSVLDEFVPFVPNENVSVRALSRYPWG